MGYDIHITRAENWCEGEEAAISLKEWEDYVERTPDLSPDPINGMPIALWTAHPNSNEFAPWLSWQDGNITAKNPDEALLAQMLAIAASLGAKVQGDDGEIYPQVADSTLEPRIGRTLRIAIMTGGIAVIALPLGLYLDSYIDAHYFDRSEAPGGWILASVLLAMLGLLCVAFGSVATLIAAIAKQKPVYLCILAALCHLFSITYLIYRG